MFSTTTKAVTLAIAISAIKAAVLPRQGLTWQISDFTIGSRDGGPTFYQLDINVETSTQECLAQNSVASTVCAGQNAPAPFPLTTCGGDGVEWQLFNTTNPTAGGGEAYFIQFRQVGETETLSGCSPLFSATNYTCESPTAPGETLVVPSSFTVEPSGNSQCVYA